MSDIAADPDQPLALRPPQVPRIVRFRTIRVVVALMLREIGSRDSRSSLGMLWSIIDPVATIVILTLAFSFLTRTPPLGTNFPLFYVTGVLPFHMYNQISNRVASSIRFSRQLLGFPSVTVLDAMFARFLLNFMIDIIVFAILTIGIIMYYDLRVNVDYGSLMLSMSMAGALAMGVGAFNSVLFMMFPAYENIWGMLNRPMMIISGVLVLINHFPDHIFHLLWWNPAAHIVSEMRHAFYPSYDASFVSPAYVFLFAAVAFVFGLITLQRYVYDALDI